MSLSQLGLCYRNGTRPRMMNRYVCRRKRLWHTLSYYCYFGLERLRKATKLFAGEMGDSRGNTQSWNRISYLNLGAAPLNCETEILSTKPMVPKVSSTAPGGRWGYLESRWALRSKGALEVGPFERVVRLFTIQMTRHRKTGITSSSPFIALRIY
jgi:hypothetical protein